MRGRYDPTFRSESIGWQRRQKFARGTGREGPVLCSTLVNCLLLLYVWEAGLGSSCATYLYTSGRLTDSPSRESLLRARTFL